MSAATWPALVLAAGYGTRLRPLSEVRAKAALPVAGRPLIVRVLESLAAAGISRAVINLHHRADTITRLVGDGAQFGLDVRYSWEMAPLGSGGGPARALPLLQSDRFFIVNADTLSGVDLGALALAHESSRAVVTLATAPVDLSRYNALLADAEGCLVGVTPRGTSPAALPPGSRPYHFVGIQAVNAAAFAAVAPSQASDTIRRIYPALWTAHPGSVRAFPTAAPFFDIGTPADYYDTTCRLAAREGLPLDRGRDCRIPVSADVETSILWDRVVVGERAHLSHCVVTDDVVIPAGARYDRVVITPQGVTPL